VVASSLLRRDLLAGAAALTIVASVLAASLSGVEARPVCRQIVLRGAVRAGDTFSRTLSGGLELRLTPTRFSDPATPAPLDGWRIEVVPVRLTGAPSGLEDRIYPVNLPLRFNPNQDIGTSYGISAKQKLQDPIDYAFVPDEQGFRAVRDRATDALWPYASRDPSRASEDYFEALDALSLGSIRFVPIHYELENGGMSIASLNFVIEVVVPEPFVLDGSASETFPCPPKQR
jgi:hypothetical protein